MPVKDPEDRTHTEELFVRLRKAYLEIDQAWIALGTVLEDREYSGTEIPFRDYLRPDELEKLREIENGLEEDVDAVEEIAEEVRDRFGLDESVL